MCCFSRPVEIVSNTNIFARSSAKDRQYLVYSMTLSAKEDVGMSLPLPVRAKSAEDAVRFMRLKEYPEFFDHMRAVFAEPLSRGRDLKDDEPNQSKGLKVVEVGEFEASFVPTVKDFARLDERF